MMMRSIMQLQRSECRNSFPVPNDIFALELLPGELAVYLYLVRCESRKTHQCWPSYRTIGEAVKMSENTVRKYVCSLADKGLIFTENTSVVTRDGLKRNGNLLYTIQPFQNVLEEHRHHQLNELKLVAERQQAAKRLEEYDRRQPRRPLCPPLATEPESLPTVLAQAERDGPVAGFAGTK